MSDEIIDQLNQAGLRPTRVMVGGAPIELSWTPDPAAPVVDSRAILVLPDLHLGDGGDSDIFRGDQGLGNEHRARFETFLRAAAAARATLQAAGRGLSVVQVGDCYDVWRAYPFHEQIPGRTYDAIRAAYQSIESLLIDELDTRFCVGNHDSILARFPPDWAFAAGARLAYSQRFCQGRVFVFHGHQGDDLVDTLAGQNGQIWVALGSALSAIVNPVGMALQEFIDRREDDKPSGGEGWVEGQGPPNGSPWQASRWSDYGGRPARFARILGAIRSTTPALTQAIRLIFVGHTHRPGISWFDFDGRAIPVVDVGSWTYGRSQFAIAEEGKVVVWQL